VGTYSTYFTTWRRPRPAAEVRQFGIPCSSDGNIPAEGGCGGPATSAGIFDGFARLEYPGAPGGTGGNYANRRTIQENSPTMLASSETNSKTYGARRRQATMRSTAPCGRPGQDQFIQTNQIGQYLDYDNIMT